MWSLVKQHFLLIMAALISDKSRTHILTKMEGIVGIVVLNVTLHGDSSWLVELCTWQSCKFKQTDVGSKFIFLRQSKAKQNKAISHSTPIQSCAFSFPRLASCCLLLSPTTIVWTAWSFFKNGKLIFWIEASALTVSRNSLAFPPTLLKL